MKKSICRALLFIAVFFPPAMKAQCTLFVLPGFAAQVPVPENSVAQQHVVNLLDKPAATAAEASWLNRLPFRIPAEEGTPLPPGSTAATPPFVLPRKN